MSPARRRLEPKNFFLNETHELSVEEKGGGGRLPKYAGISWPEKAARLHHSMQSTITTVRDSRDPLRNDRYFVVAQPTESVRKLSTDKRKAPEGSFEEATDFGSSHGRVFDRLGLDLLQVTEDGTAVVHGDRDKIEQLLARTEDLADLGGREQAKWVTLDLFDVIPPELRVDDDWLSSHRSKEPFDIVIELQPILTRREADIVLRALVGEIEKDDGKLSGSGSDFSGRFWFRGRSTKRVVRTIARDFYSIQAIHSPLYSIAASPARQGRGRERIAVQRATTERDPRTLPCVAVVDLGIPSDHLQLSSFRRGQFIPQDVPANSTNDHGVFVASRVVFGRCESDEELAECVGECSFYDVVVGDYPDGPRNNLINDKVVMDALRGVRGAAPDVRVFNLSIGDARPLSAFSEIERREKRRLLQDLDNFVFASDVVVVVAAGNSTSGTPPNHPYPRHIDDERWGLGPWAAGFNTLVCGAYVSRLSTDGLVQNTGWPSPFSRIGPGVSGAPIPTFAAEGGNSDSNYRWRNGLGVWGFSRDGLPEDRPGTSFAAPLLAREAALALNSLSEHCADDARPFAVLVRAYLALTAQPTTTDPQVRELAKRTLGLGEATVARLKRPVPQRALVLWQGVIESSKDVVRVQIPVPLDWLAAADEPILRLVVAYDPPVNEAAASKWACRKVRAVLKTDPDERGIHPTPGQHETYPLIVREYALAKFAPGTEKAATRDMWLLELSYDEISPYVAGADFAQQQRAGVAIELLDRGAANADPQDALQALPAAQTMTRLASAAAPIRTPIILRSRITR